MSILTDNPQLPTFVQGGVALMVTGWLGYQVRALPGQIMDAARTWATRVVEIRENSPLYDAWLAMVTEGAVRRGGPRTVEVRSVSGVEEGSRARAALRAGADSFWARLCGKWCRIHVGRDDGAGGRNAADLVRRFVLRIEIVGGTREDLARLLAEAESRANVMERRQIVHLCNKWGSHQVVCLPKRSPETLCLPAGLFDSIERRLREFRAGRENYERVGIPWRLGILLHGEPGTGKTSLAHALGSRLGLRLAILPLADLESDEELVTAFTSMPEGSIVVLEDVDAAFRARASQDAGGITFSTFLNCIDGMLAPHDGRVLILSTNHPERLDPALVRPGRIDLRVEVPLLGAQAAADYVDRVFPHVAARHDIVREVMAMDRATPAMLINRIMQEKWQRGEWAAASPEACPNAAWGEGAPFAGAPVGREDSSHDDHAEEFDDLD